MLFNFFCAIDPVVTEPQVKRVGLNVAWLQTCLLGDCCQLCSREGPNQTDPVRSAL